MSGSSTLNVPVGLKQRIERAARARKEEPSSLIASAVDLLLETEQIQLDAVCRRLSSRSGKTIPNERVAEWLKTWGLKGEVTPPKCD